jgi:hypothetical protein
MAVLWQSLQSNDFCGAHSLWHVFTLSWLRCRFSADSQLNKEIYDQRINDKLGLMLAGMAKIFVADIVELGELGFDIVSLFFGSRCDPRPSFPSAQSRQPLPSLNGEKICPLLSHPSFRYLVQKSSCLNSSYNFKVYPHSYADDQPKISSHTPLIRPDRSSRIISGWPVESWKRGEFFLRRTPQGEVGRNHCSGGET